ncbi:hypothetical protein SASPL_105423 [Salvia splendens]|uniref:Uncharacterized protein n=1 Tax=Salvia splendens TaxID=180675 RepID=A0A8X8YJX4_SALSN|nr:hypothetical protein SASPL_105423 [Salvia splendens]
MLLLVLPPSAPSSAAASSSTRSGSPVALSARRRVSPAAVAGLGQQGRSGCGVAAAGASLAAGASRDSGDAGRAAGCSTFELLILSLCSNA